MHSIGITAEPFIVTRNPWIVAHTLRHLRPMQLMYWGWRRVLQPRLESQVSGGISQAFQSPVQFSFLNRTVRFVGQEFRWYEPKQSRLWNYNLHYFNYLRDPSRSDTEKFSLIQYWIEANPKGSTPGWEPYPTSLRLVNWCRWLTLYPEEVSAEAWESVAEQLDWLSRHLETHILANHYFENLKALVYAGVVLQQDKARRSLPKAQRRLKEQLREQFLPDGGHYERSPSYHCLLTDGLLDLLELDQWLPYRMDPELLLMVRERAQSGLGLLSAIEMPGDRYPLFNDSAFDSAPLPSQLYARAAALSVQWRAAERDRLLDYPAFGVFGFHDSSGTALAIKCGAVGPDYQPGHTHCDLLSYEWFVAGHPIVVDTGVYEYQPGAMRRYVRSTAAHNTVAVDDAEQSEIWGEFRVGRRARVCDASIERGSGGVRFEGAVDVFPGLGRMRHWREIDCRQDADGWCLEVCDEIKGAGRHRLSSRVLLHPAITVHAAGNECLLYREGVLMGRLTSTGPVSMEIVDAPYCPEFGLKLMAQQLVMTCHATLPARLGYRLKIFGAPSHP